MRTSTSWRSPPHGGGALELDEQVAYALGEGQRAADVAGCLDLQDAAAVAIGGAWDRRPAACVTHAHRNGRTVVGGGPRGAAGPRVRGVVGEGGRPLGRRRGRLDAHRKRKAALGQHERKCAAACRGFVGDDEERTHRRLTAKVPLRVASGVDQRGGGLFGGVPRHGEPTAKDPQIAGLLE
jgi:hypothetical protein